MVEDIVDMVVDEGVVDVVEVVADVDVVVVDVDVVVVEDSMIKKIAGNCLQIIN